MWLFTRHGFFSVVSARAGDGAHGNPVDPQRMMVRARRREHLDRLKAKCAPLLDACDIVESGSTDYAFRLFVAKELWREVAAALATDIDYDNFKSEVARHQGAAGREYEQALHDVWSVMFSLQERRR